MTPAASMTQRRTLEDLSERVFGRWPLDVEISALNQIEASNLIAFQNPTLDRLELLRQFLGADTLDAAAKVCREIAGV